MKGLDAVDSVEVEGGEKSKFREGEAHWRKNTEGIETAKQGRERSVLVLFKGKTRGWGEEHYGPSLNMVGSRER